MKKFLSLFLVLCACLTTAWCVAEPIPPATHPLKGVVMGLLPEKTALLVKHEEVPGVMRAMTMMFKVGPAVLEKVKRGDTITARMSRREDGWWLTDVEVVPFAAPAGQRGCRSAVAGVGDPGLLRCEAMLLGGHRPRLQLHSNRS
jgi:Cu/Ag efflux protein CusF